MNPNISATNIYRIKQKILQHKLNYCVPHYENEDAVRQIVTDHDVFPYPRYFRGEFCSSDPIIAEREAGYRKIQTPCYTAQCSTTPHTGFDVDEPNLCFETACSVVLPCCPSKANSKWILDQHNFRVVVPP